MAEFMYVSTRGSAPKLTFEEAMMTGLARDGGLYVPETIPNPTKRSPFASCARSSDRPLRMTNFAD